MKISEKIDELIALAEKEGDTNTQVVLLILRGAQCAGDDAMLAVYLQDFAQNILMSRVKAAKEAHRIITNN